jgi:hypothetical protein
VAKGLAVPILYRNRSLCLLDVVKGIVRQRYLRVSENVFGHFFRLKKVPATAASSGNRFYYLELKAMTHSLASARRRRGALSFGLIQKKQKINTERCFLAQG